MSAFIERVTGGQVGGAIERSIRLSLSFIRLGPVIIIEALQTYESDASLVGVDGAVEATQAIIGGDMDATVAQNPYAMGKVGVEEATKAAKGKSIDPKINTGLTLVTKENAPSYLKIREKQLGALLGVED